MCAIPQLVSVPLNPIPIAEHFRTLYVRRRHIWNCFEKAAFCQVTDLNFRQLIACLFGAGLDFALGTITSKYQLKRKLQRDLKKLLLELREPSV